MYIAAKQRYMQTLGVEQDGILNTPFDKHIFIIIDCFIFKNSTREAE